MQWTVIFISLGAILGALSRYYLVIFWVQRAGQAFPYGILFVNLTGAFLIGFVTTLESQLTNLLSDLKPLIVTGFLGSYTTFSSYILDVNYFWRSRYWRKAIFYWVGTPCLGILCLEIGVYLGRCTIQLFG